MRTLAMTLVVAALVMACGAIDAQEQQSGRQMLEDIKVLRALNQLNLAPDQWEQLLAALREAEQQTAQAPVKEALTPEQVAGLIAMRDELARGVEPTRAEEAGATEAMRVIAEAAGSAKRARLEAGRRIAAILNNYQIEQLGKLAGKGGKPPKAGLQKMGEDARKRTQAVLNVFGRAAKGAFPGEDMLPLERMAEELVRLKYGKAGAPDHEEAIGEAAADLAEIEGLGVEGTKQIYMQKVKAWAPDVKLMKQEAICAAALDFLLVPRVVELVAMAAKARAE